MTYRDDDPDRDDARADDFRCRSCDRPLAQPWTSRRLCAECEARA